MDYCRKILSTYKGTVYIISMISIFALLNHYGIRMTESMADNIMKTVVFISYFIMITIESMKEELIKYFKHKSYKIGCAEGVYGMIHLLTMVLFSVATMMIYC